MRTDKLLRGTALAAVLVAFATTAQAQDDGLGREIEEIVVTAQKREQSLQDVPIVITSVSGELLRDAGVRDIRELTLLSPGLTVTATTNETIVTARIRGVGTVGDNPGLESSVGVVIDGVYRPRNGVGFGDLGEVERIEVLKGPQGTLFGKNTSAGVISIITAAPGSQLEARSEATRGNYGAWGVTGALSGPVAEGMSLGLYAAMRRRDGFIDIVQGRQTREPDDVNQNFYTLRGQAVWEASADFTARMIVDYTKRNEDCCVGTQLFVGSSPAGRGQFINAVRPGSIDLTSTPFDRAGYANRPTDQRVTDKGGSLEFSLALGPDVELTSISAIRGWRAATGQDSDFTAADLVWRPNDGNNYVSFNQISQEIRLDGETDSLSWLVGGFFASEDLKSRSQLLYGTDYYAYFASRVLGGVPGLIGLTPAAIFQTGRGQDDRFAQNGKTFALFTNNSVRLNDQVEFTLGLRYTEDRKTLDSTYSTTGSSCDQGEAAFGTLVGVVGAATAQTIVGGLCLNHQNNDFDELGTLRQKSTERELSGTAKLAYRINDDAMTYLSYSRGYKAGGFNLDREQRIVTTAGLNFTADTDTSFRPEIVDSWELGAKTKWASNSLLLNAALFHQTFQDFQLNTFAGTAFIVETLPKVTSRGLDLDFIYLPPVDGLSLQGGVTYAETEVKPFTANSLLVPSRFNSLRRLPGARLSFAPLWSASLAASYEAPISDSLVLRANLSGKYTSRYNTGSDLHPSKVQDAMILMNGRIGIGSEDERWTLEFWGANLTDKDYLQVGFNGPFQIDENNDSISVYNAFLGAPRTYGVTLRLAY